MRHSLSCANPDLVLDPLHRPCLFVPPTGSSDHSTPTSLHLDSGGLPPASRGDFTRSIWWDFMSLLSRATERPLISRIFVTGGKETWIAEGERNLESISSPTTGRGDSDKINETVPWHFRLICILVEG
jgi:hypothetical protein